MNIYNEPLLKTERLVLRPIKLRDLSIVQKYSLEDDFFRFLDFHTKESVKEFVELAVISDWNDNARFVITLKSETIGSVGLYINQKEKIAEIKNYSHCDVTISHVKDIKRIILIENMNKIYNITKEEPID